MRTVRKRVAGPSAWPLESHDANLQEIRHVIEFENEASFSTRARNLQGLEEASDDDIADVEIEAGYALHWERLDVDFSIPGLIAGVFGTARFMAAKGGRSRSAAKAAAARENGRKGGRPRKEA